MCASYEVHGTPPEKKRSVRLASYPDHGINWQKAWKKAQEFIEDGYRNVRVVEVPSSNNN
jgi:hypothetical protein